MKEHTPCIQRIYKKSFYSVLFLLSLFFSFFSAKEALADENAYGNVNLFILDSEKELKDKFHKPIVFKQVLEVSLKPDWHIYWKFPGDSGFPPSLKYGDEEAKLIFPAPKKFITPPKDVSYGYSNKVYILIAGEPQESKQSTLNFLVCDPKGCYPKQTLLNANKISKSDKLIAKIEEKFLNGQLSFPDYCCSNPINVELKLKQIAPEKHRLTFNAKSPEKEISSINLPKPEDFLIDYDKKLNLDLSKENEFSQSWILSEDILDRPEKTELNFLIEYKSGHKSLFSKTIAFPKEIKDLPKKIEPLSSQPEKEKKSLFYYLILAFLGGVILNFMPCVLPVLSLKIFDFLKKTEKEKAKSSSFYSLLGIITSFLGLAFLVIILKSSGEKIGWGFHFQNSSFIVILLNLIFLLALNMYGIFEFNFSFLGKLSGKSSGEKAEGKLASFLAGVLTTLLATPCSAPFLGTAVSFAFTTSSVNIILVFLFLGIGMGLPYLLIIFFPSLLRFFPKPGMWMEKLKKFLSFLLFGTAIWLFDILLFTSGSGAFIGLSSALLFLGIAAWVYQMSFESSGMSYRILQILAFTLLVISTKLSLDAVKLEASETQKVSSQWEKFNEERLKELLLKNKRVYIDVTAKWCATCKTNKSLVMDKADFLEAAEKNSIVLMRADWTKKDDQIGKFLEKYNKFGIPFNILFYGDTGKYYVFPEILSLNKVLSKFKSSD